MIWKPLSVPAGATPEEALLLAAKASNTAECVLLGWVKNFGWCGCYAVTSMPGCPAPAPAIHLMNVKDVSIVAVRRQEKIHLPHIGADNGNPA